MALPANLFRQDLKLERGTGITLALYAADMAYDFKIERAPDSAGAPDTGNIVTIARIAGTRTSYFDELPLDALTRWYRLRHAMDGEDDSAATGWVSGVPIRLEQPELPKRRTATGTKVGNLAADIEGTRSVIGGSLFVPSTETVKVGSAAAPATIQKVVRIPPAELIPESDTYDFQFAAASGGYVQPRLVGSYLVLYGAVVLPAGITLTNFSARFYRGSTRETGICKLIRIDSSGAVTTLATLTAVTTGGWSTVSGAVSELTAGDTYALQVDLQTLAPSVASDARFARAEITYTMPSYDKAI